MSAPIDAETKRRNIYLPESVDRLGEEIAERTDGGNFSRLVRRLIREEAVRIDEVGSSGRTPLRDLLAVAS